MARPLEEFTFDEKYVIPRNSSCGSCYISMATSLENKTILFYIDNNALVSIVDKRSSKETWIMKMIRPFVLITMKHNVQFKAIHIESANNGVADAISRFQMDRFRSLVPVANRFPEEIPQAFLTLILNIQ